MQFEHVDDMMTQKTEGKDRFQYRGVDRNTIIIIIMF